MPSAASAGSSFDLQCELREKAIDFVHRNYPQCLPKAREEGKPMREWRTTEEVAPRTWPPPDGAEASVNGVEVAGQDGH